MDTERTASSRHEIRAPVAYWGTDLKGGGTIANISTSGALIERATHPVSPGTRLGILVRYFPDGAEHCSVELTSEVIRTTDGGFAVQFKDLGPEALFLLCGLLP
ncbi:MAG: PilZ domain-containing protein [Myxococcota bacterium]